MPTNIIKADGAKEDVRAYLMSEIPRKRLAGAQNCMDPMAVEKEAYQRGFESGERAGMQLAAKKMAVQAEKLGRLTESISGAREEMLDGHAEEIIALAFAVAKRILRSETALKEGPAVPVLKEAIADAFGSERVAVRLSVQDMRFVRENPAVAKELRRGQKGVVFEEDPGLSPGGCKVVTEHKEIDGSLEAQWEELYRVLVKGLEAGDAGV